MGSESDLHTERLSRDLVRVIRNFPRPHDSFFRLAVHDLDWLSLVINDPALALIAARVEDFGALPLKRFVHLGKEHICAAAGFPVDERSVRLLRKFEIHSDRVISDLLVLRWLLAHEPCAFDILEAKPEIAPEDLNHLACGIRKFESWGDLSALEWFFSLPTAMRHFIGRIYADAAEQYSETVEALLGPVKPLSDFCNKEQAISWLTKYAGYKERIEMAETDDECTEWPEPPIPGIPTIEPIRSLADLEEECRRLNHHMDCFSLRVVQGDYYFYRVQTDPPSTLGIAYRDGSWVVDSLRGQDGKIDQDARVLADVSAWLLAAPDSSRDVSQRKGLWRNYLRRIAEKAKIPANTE